ncbi:MAG TPA: hypothetical protein VEC57_20510 [Candidatus Limnocylindrales bacterium]|nr:hypothetical protein [Candidatus Limnocylindrales bacterium]
MSSLIYSISREALGLREPRWTNEGEILNLDRHVLMGWPQLHGSRKFSMRAQHRCDREQIFAFLDDAAHREGFAYKDVVQPFALAAWPGLARFRVLKVTRDVAEVAASMLERGWHYPAVAATTSPAGLPQAAVARARRAAVTHSLWRIAARRVVRTPVHDRWTAQLLLDELITGLLLAERALSSVAGETVAYADAVRDPQCLLTALRRLYPDRELGNPSYIDEGFARRRAALEARRRSPKFERLRRRVQTIRDALDEARS